MLVFMKNHNIFDVLRNQFTEGCFHMVNFVSGSFDGSRFVYANMTRICRYYAPVRPQKKCRKCTGIHKRSARQEMYMSGRAVYQLTDEIRSTVTEFVLTIAISQSHIGFNQKPPELSDEHRDCSRFSEKSYFTPPNRLHYTSTPPSDNTCKKRFFKTILQNLQISTGRVDNGRLTR